MAAPGVYLILPGTAREALAHYESVFGGSATVHTFEEFGRTDGPGDAVAHGMLTGPVDLYASDAAPGQTSDHGDGVMLALLGAAPPATLRAWFAALAENGEVQDPLQRRPWGDWDGQVRDAFGVRWLIGFEASALEQESAGTTDRDGRSA